MSAVAGPLVSVITAAYNAAPYLEETIESVLSQDYAALEYVVLDDGSTDGTPAILARYEGRLRHERHPNMGEARTVNRGFEVTSGEIVGVVSADDPLLPGAVAAAVRTLDAHPEAIVVYPDWVMIDGEGTVLEEITTFEYDYLDMLRWHHCVPGPGTFFRRSVVDALGGRDPQFRYVGDFDFWLRAGLLGEFRRIPEVRARYRWHTTSASASRQSAEMAREHIELADKIFSLPDLPPAARRLRREAYSSAHWIAGVVAGDDNVALRRRYWWRALLLVPAKYRGEYRARFDAMRPVLFGRLYRPLRPARRGVARLKAWTRRRRA